MPAAKKKAGRPAYSPSQYDRQQVEQMAALGIRKEDIAIVLGIHRNTLTRHYTDELARAGVQANAVIAKTLFNMARSGKNVAATIFWLKCQGKWRETDPKETADTVKEIKIVGGLPD